MIIFLLGGEVIRGFIFALLIGVMIGTYSSLFTASPIAYDLLGGDKQEKEILEKEAEKPTSQEKEKLVYQKTSKKALISDSFFYF